jgi:hypothetical protein
MAVQYERFTNEGGRGNRTALITVTSDLSVSQGTLSNLVDGAFGANSSDSIEIGAGQSGKYIQFDFGATKKKSITGFNWQKSNTGDHGTWKMQASNDASSWSDIIDAVSTATTIVKGRTNGTNLGYYRYFRLLQVTGTTSSSPWNVEIEFCIHDEDGADDQALIAPNYINFLSTGDRRLYMFIDGTTVLSGSGKEPLINGALDNVSFFSGGQSGTYLEFDFLSDVLITEVKWYQDSGTTHGTWKWQHYDRDLASWVDVGATFTLGGTTQTITVMSGASTYHSKYRLAQVSGSTSSSPWTREIEFLVGYPAITSEAIDSVTPSSGSAAGGTPVVIEGGGFTSATGVLFDASSATNFVVVDDTEITCDTPAHANGTVDVTVQRPTTNLVLVNGYTYTSTPAPSFTSVTPDSGPSLGGTAVAIVGDNLTDVTSVEFGGVPATSLVIVDDENLTCVTPAGVQGPTDIELFSVNGDTIEPDAFTYTVAARVTQTPLLVVNLPIQQAKVTQVPLLVVNLPVQGTKITQLPLLPLYVPPPIPLPFPIIPNLPVIETWQYLTVMTGAEGSREQRASLRTYPRTILNFSAVIEDDEHRRDVYQMLFKYINRVFDYPNYIHLTRLTASAVAGATKLFFDPAATDMREGGTLALFDAEDERTTLYLTISTLDSDGANLVLPLPINVPRSWYVCPAFNFRTAAIVGFNMSSINGTFDIQLESTSPRTLERPDASPTLVMIDGMLLLNDRPLTVDDVDESFDQNVTWLDNEIAPPEPKTNWPIPFMSGTRQYFVDRPTDMDYWRSVAHTLRGRQNPFLLPTHRNDLPLVETPSLGATSLVTSNIQYADMWRQRTYQYLQIENANAIIYRRVLEAITNYDVDGDPITVTLKLSASIGAVAGDNVISAISYVNICRLDTDEIELNHGEGGTTVLTIQVRSINE